MAPSQQLDGDGKVSKPVRRMRWATQRLTGQNGANKRSSILKRVPMVTVSSSDEKSNSNRSSKTPDESDQGRDEQISKPNSRTIYLNVPLPDEAKTKEGHNKQHFPRNKIRTSRYTPISFIPKNLYYQFHNIANCYFLFLIVLSVRSSPSRIAAVGLILTLAVFFHIRRFKPGSRLLAASLYPVRDSGQGWHRRLAKDSA